jgi:tRNA G37 N-methylase TrmD
MCWTPSYTRHKTKTNQKQHSTISVGHHHTQDTRRRQKHKNTTQYVLDTIIHKTQDEDKQKTAEHNMCWTPSYTRHKTKTNTQKHNTICVGHHHTQDTRRRQTHKNCVFIFVLCLVYDGVQHILCCVFVCLSSSCVLCMMVSNTYCVVLLCVCLRFVSCV